MTISRRLTWLNALVSAAALALACAAFLVYDQVTFRKNLVANVSAQADVVGLNSVSALMFNDPDAAQSSLSALATSHNVLGATLFTDDGQIFASYARGPQDRVSKIPPMEPGETAKYVFAGTHVLVARVVDFQGKHVGTIVVRGDLSDLRRRLLQYIVISAGVLILSLLAALALSSVFRRAVAAPIVKLADTARVISRDKNYAVRAETLGARDEVGLLVEAFNEMLQQIQQRESALETERARLGAIIENAPFGIVVAEAPSRHIIIANKQSEDILGLVFRPESPVRLQEQALRTPDDQLLLPEQYPVTRAFAGDVVHAEELIYVRPDGTQTWLRVFAAPIHDRTGATVAAVVAFSDIAGQKRAQEALLQSEKLAAAGRLAASIAHEINNPLESVTNLLFLALNDGQLSEETRSFLMQADEELARVSQIATQTLRFYRQSTRPTSANVGDLLDSVLHLLRGRLANVNVNVTRQYRLSHDLLCFEGELRQVFTNLIGNAIDAMRQGNGRLLLRASEGHNWKTDMPGIRVSICDNGHGIPQDVVARIFEPFYSTKGSRGTGLGLWVTREIIAKHRGTVRVRSKANVGTTFSIFLPFDGVRASTIVAA